ncbi:Os08g0150500 [Oryza sativa Japonica Group]|uniref:Os08g0150500 protein n=1 Tax=Oryza sativa subsp. japonica TaxID=39947 RepID=A0A0P0XBN6_ORYSJ|nr:Os08g0150500 [Oryza sativa Japonica Group]
MPLRDLHSHLSPRPRPVNWDPGGPASFSVRLFRLSLSSGSPQAPSRDHLRVDHGVTSASARGSVASVATRDSSAVDVATSYGSPPPPPRATPPVARSYVASPPRCDTANPSTRHGGQTTAATCWPPPTNAVRSHLRVGRSRVRLCPPARAPSGAAMSGNRHPPLAPRDSPQPSLGSTCG